MHGLPRRRFSNAGFMTRMQNFVALIGWMSRREKFSNAGLCVPNRSTSVLEYTHTPSLFIKFVNVQRNNGMQMTRYTQRCHRHRHGQRPAALEEERARDEPKAGRPECIHLQRSARGKTSRRYVADNSKWNMRMSDRFIMEKRCSIYVMLLLIQRGTHTKDYGINDKKEKKDKSDGEDHKEGLCTNNFFDGSPARNLHINHAIESCDINIGGFEAPQGPKNIV
ncbi:hypothetical protein TcasGA2_TC003705 [Tribolium castaneum]|uniref:Uncharacterized protein n=1 Tax=Tribolium castaneum TaxID=7070 RepID=D6WDR1_TRICA|nr:hypothetical protein TcasGA2_TC003705 [Tribolium castaneum]